MIIGQLLDNCSSLAYIISYMFNNNNNVDESERNDGIAMISDFYKEVTKLVFRVKSIIKGGWGGGVRICTEPIHLAE